MMPTVRFDPTKTRQRSTARQEAGDRWEQHALDQLLAAGLTLVTRNYRSRQGEIDLICNDNGILVFVEVRFRTASSLARASETVTRHKQRRLIAAARHFIACHPNIRNAPMRFDVVAIDGISEDQHSTEWIRHAFELG